MDSAAAVFKDLCLDVTRSSVAAAFWGPVLGLADSDTGRVPALVDRIDEHRLWLNPVPEPKTEKLRIHLDVHVASVSELVHRGAVVVDDSHGWTVLTDPEGNEFCAFVRPPAELEPYRLYELVIDAVDPLAIARWWAAVLGTQAVEETDGSAWLTDVPGGVVELGFVPVPEPKTTKNRLHWDVWGSTRDLLAAGATALRSRDAEIGWDVLADPEGNEFCVFARAAVDQGDSSG